MGWTSTDARHYKTNGKVDVKAECDSLWNCSHLQVLKSSMVGTTYYAAVAITGKRENGNVIPIPKEQQKVVGVVTLTSTRNDDGFNFGYKEMDETVCPYYFDCPLSILNLLTPTDSEWANKWRDKCRENAERKKQERKNPDSLNNLPIGSVIECNGKQVIKSAPSFQFKRAWWRIIGEYKYYSTKFIRQTGYKVLSRA